MTERSAGQLVVIALFAVILVVTGLSHALYHRFRKKRIVGCRTCKLVYKPADRPPSCVTDHKIEVIYPGWYMFVLIVVGFNLFVGFNRALYAHRPNLRLLAGHAFGEWLFMGTALAVATCVGIVTWMRYRNGPLNPLGREYLGLAIGGAMSLGSLIPDLPDAIRTASGMWP